MKDVNLQAMKTNANNSPMFKILLISLELSDSDIETEVHTWRTVEYNPLVHNAVFETVINVTNMPV